MRNPIFNGTDPREILAVVDEKDREIGGEARHFIHSTGLLHRAVHVFVFVPDGRLLLQQRSEKKDTFPLHWECVGGHLSPGETYDAAAFREVHEELGVEAHKLQLLQKLSACAETGQEFIQVYTARIEDDPQPHVDEVIALCWFTRDGLRGEVVKAARRFSPSLLHSMRCIGLLERADIWHS